MRTNVRKHGKRPAFTIVELLTVMSVIIILFGLLAPAMNKVKIYAKRVKQKGQFHSIGVALDLFSNEFEGYPDSDWEDSTGATINYCGAMKLCEAMVGQDLLGFHPDSLFNAAGLNPSAAYPLYPDAYTTPAVPPYPQWYYDNLSSRKGPYLPIDNANTNTLPDLYGPSPAFGTLGDPVDTNRGIVLCDEFPRARNETTGKRIGMPVLYYKADISKNLHDFTQPALSIYNHLDNDELVKLMLPWDSAHTHPMASVGTTPDGVPADASIFYTSTLDEKVTSIVRPKMVDSYILISAGFDGLYGTRDDVFNFGN